MNEGRRGERGGKGLGVDMLCMMLIFDGDVKKKRTKEEGRRDHFVSLKHLQNPRRVF